ncbi:MAG: hypothetical protein HYV13_00780 [Candidatus Doudnabacteria bacterium]|nr:hypothetical protein [Candidatus Doudnabacteria bacterium]
MTLNPYLITSMRGKRDGIAGHSERRLAIVLPSGLFAGYLGGAACWALHKLGFANVPTTIVGFSAGALTGAFWVSGQLNDHVMNLALTYHDRNRDVVRPWRIGKIFDVDRVIDSIAQDFDLATFMASPINLLVGVATEGGHGELLDVKTAKPGPFDALKAAIAMPWPMFNRHIEVNGHLYGDQIFDPLPIEDIIKATNPTDVLIIANQPKRPIDEWRLSGADLALAALRLTAPEVAMKMLGRKARLRKALRFCEECPDINIGVLYPPSSSRGLTRDAESLRHAIIETAKATAEAFGEQLNISQVVRG